MQRPMDRPASKKPSQNAVCRAAGGHQPEIRAIATALPEALGCNRRVEALLSNVPPENVEAMARAARA